MQKYLGYPAPRREDAALVKGYGRYTDDIALDHPLYIAFQRSTLPCGRIAKVDIADALATDGVHAVHTGADVAHLGRLSVNPVLPISELPDFPILGDDKVFAVGQPIAAVLADSAWAAMDGAEAVCVDIAKLDASPTIIAAKSWKTERVAAAFADADVVVECELHHPRLAPSPIEPRCIAVQYHHETDNVTVWHSTQTPHRSRNELACILGIGKDRIRVVAPDVGGAFGMKASLYPEDVLAVWAALKHKRNVKWTASRAEDFLSATHGRGITSKGRLALSHGGRFLALEAEIHAPLGHWVPNSGLVPAWNAARILPSAYRIDQIDINTRAVTSHTAAIGIYRGAGRPEANCLMERLVDKAARATGLHPLHIRKQNLLPAECLPYRTPTGNVLDSGNYQQAMILFEEACGYSDALQDQKRRRGLGELVGLGIGFYLEPSGNGWETANVTLHQDSTVTVASGSSSQGHGRETAFAQIAADILDITIDNVTVILGDTETCPEGIGALASRSTAIGGSAVLKACQDIRTQLAAGQKAPLSAEIHYENDGQAWGYGCYFVALSIHRETGVITLEKIVCVDDIGTITNPLFVDAQILGGFAQGMGEALMEEIIYDADGQIITASFADYAIPRAADIPALRIVKMTTPSPFNLLGAKGVGEAGTIGAPAAILNAAIDALSPLKITDLDMPLTSQRLWRAIRDAEKGTTR